MGSSFEDLDTINPFLKTDRDFETRFARYFFFRLKSEKEKRKKTPELAPSLSANEGQAPSLHVVRRGRARGARPRLGSVHVLLADVGETVLSESARFF